MDSFLGLFGLVYSYGENSFIYFSPDFGIYTSKFYFSVFYVPNNYSDIPSKIFLFFS